ncbi:MAG: hypothetical protein IT165_28705 [Bryobacterales bacterium]|nr:hypothetical protein [Bryobacterales bacterium]
MDLQELAEQWVADYDRHQPGARLASEVLTLTVEEAYRLQMEAARLREARGEPVAGYKIGCLSAAIQTQFGLDQPVFGHIYQTEVYPSGVVLDPARHENLAIEGEFGVRLAEDIPDSNWLRAHADQVLATAFPVIELHNYVFRNTPHCAQELIANNALHAGVVLPQFEPSARDARALLDGRIEIVRNGEVLGLASGQALPEFPFGSIIRLADHLARFGRRLRRGQLILTGSPLALYPVFEGDRIEVTSGGLGVAARVKGRPQ